MALKLSNAPLAEIAANEIRAILLRQGYGGQARGFRKQQLVFPNSAYYKYAAPMS
jgi:hypothetical protein